MESTVHREIRIDRNLCMGSGQCLWYAPNTFEQDESNVAVVIDQQGDPDGTIQTAVDSCPTRAITVVGEQN
jgi:ferredoxin